MQQKQKNSMLAAAILAGLLSLPMTWMTIRDAQFQGGPGSLFNSAFGGITLDVTGFNGHVTLLFKTPIWFIILVTVSASVLQIMKASRLFAVPRVLEIGTAAAGTGWVSVALGVGLFSGRATLGVGALLGLFAAATPLVLALLPTPNSDSTKNEDKV